MEIWDGYYRDGTPAGVDLIRDTPIPEGLYHLTVNVLVRHADGSYLIMHRDPNKRLFPDWWEAGAGGSAIKGEDSETAARRELREETGIKADRMTFLYRHIMGETLFDMFLCETDCDKDSIVLQEGETVGYRWMTEAEFRAFVNSDRFIPSVAPCWERYFQELGYKG